jgi:hypothetical protein
MDEQSQPPASPKQPQNEEGTQQPVAYDSQGRPLYAAPPSQVPPAQSSYNNEPGPQFVHLSRAVAPQAQPISPELKAKHDESLKLFPFLNISEAEFVISAVRRHPIALVLPVAIAIFLVAVTASLMINYSIFMNAMGVYDPPPYGTILFIGSLFILLVLLGLYINIWIYRNNRFFLTNESVIQEIQTGLFSHHEQTVSLANIEDASYRQNGIIQIMFNYGSIRLSTEGEETTYRFNYVSNPKEQIATLNNAVEAFKNGRPVTND